MGPFWAILAVSDSTLSGGRRILLARMYLLDNGQRGCTAHAGTLGALCGLSAETAEHYRRELESKGLLRRVAQTRAWHVVLPPNPPPDRATSEEIQAYARRIEAVIGPEPPYRKSESPFGFEPNEHSGGTRTPVRDSENATRTITDPHPNPRSGEPEPAFGSNPNQDSGGEPEREFGFRQTENRIPVRDFVLNRGAPGAAHQPHGTHELVGETQEKALMSPVAHATTESRDSRDTAFPAGRCSDCGEPLRLSARGRIMPCGCAGPQAAEDADKTGDA